MNNLSTIEDGSVLAGLIVLEWITPAGVEWTREEIATVCGCTINNVKDTEQRAIKRMKTGFIEAFKRRGLINGTESEDEIIDKILTFFEKDIPVEGSIPRMVGQNVPSLIGNIVRQGRRSGKFNTKET